MQREDGKSTVLVERIMLIFLGILMVTSRLILGL